MDKMGQLAADVFNAKYSMDGVETWAETAARVASNVMGAVDSQNYEKSMIEVLIAQRKFMPGGRYLYASGRPSHQTQNCILLRADDSREGWSELMYKASMATMSGAGIGVDYSDIRPRGTKIGTGGIATGPCALMKAINEIGRQVMGGGARRAAIWAGLSWQHPDVKEFIRIKDWSPELREQKAQNFEFELPMELTNVSVILDDEFFSAINDNEHPKAQLAHDIYSMVVKRMLKTAEPGFSVNVGENAGETLRNACTEVTSADDSDVCNLGSLNMARFDTLEEFSQAVWDATHFLVAGTVYSHLPYHIVKEVREKNRRLGLGLMGIHEWLLKRNKPYGPDKELAEWLDVYKTVSDQSAAIHADRYGLSKPVKVRAIAPTGTIGIVAETTTGIEPIFCTAYIRRWSNGDGGWNQDYVIDPTAARLVEEGVDPDEIEDAYSIDYRRRIEFQAWVQKWVDHGISSTINLPKQITDDAGRVHFGDTLLDFLPDLRGITVYPDGARSGQPITPVSYQEAAEAKEMSVFLDEQAACIGGVCGV